MNFAHIQKNVQQILASLPPQVSLVAAGKTRSPEELQAVIEAGVRIIGHNYVQEAEHSVEALGRDAIRWHCIGHLQRNKVKRAVQLFDEIETVDSLRLAQALDRACAEAGKQMPILIEVNSGQEEAKTGIVPEDVMELAQALSNFENLRVEGLMTLGRFSADPDVCRPCFRKTRALFDSLAAARIPGVAMKHLSMGMSDSYQVAIEEGATRVRIGTRLFGPRL